MISRILNAWDRLDACLSRRRLLLGAALALVLSGTLVAYNISFGPLSNLNDIGGWSNRALYMAMTAAAHAAVLLLCTALYQGRFSQLALREVILTAGVYIMQEAINQKTHLFVETILPLVRAMDEGGLAAMAGWETNLSAPAMTLLYLVTRGPVYDMYMLKLLCTSCYLVLCVLMAHAADRKNMGLRAQVLLVLCVILPQGFMNAACSAALDLAALVLLGISLSLAFCCDRHCPLGAALCFGAAAALNGAALYALPVYLYLTAKRRMELRHLGAAAAIMLALCVPAIAGGMPAGEALSSLLRANLGTPAYAAGAPHIMNLIARPLAEETPQYVSMLRHLPALDTAANAQQDYTAPYHYIWATRGLTLAGLAGYLGVCALATRQNKGLKAAMTLALGALLVCPGVTSGAWLAVDLLCLLVLVYAPELRLPACMVLFATAGAACYPMTEETVLPMAMAALLCLLALLMLLDVIPTGKGEEELHA